MAEEYRTIMYSIGVKGEVIVHKFPWNARTREGMQKLQKLVRRGFTFDDPSKGGLAIPQVIVTRVVELERPESVEEDLPASNEPSGFDEPLVIPEVEEEQEFLIPCPECGMKCKTHWGLKVHQRTHGWADLVVELEPAKKRGKYKKREKVGEI